MTNSLIPYSFVPGTKAKAQEVNANFISLAEQIQNNHTSIGNQLTELEENLTENIENVSQKCPDMDLINTNTFTNTIMEAPNGVATYEASTITIPEGLKVVIPNGRQEDNKLKNIVYTTTEPITKTVTNMQGVKSALFLYSNGTFEVVNQKEIFYKNTTPTTLNNNVHWYKIDENKWYRYILAESRWEEALAIPIANLNWTDDSEIYSMTTSQPINLLKANDLNNFYTIKGILPKDLDYIIERYKSGKGFYTLYKSGWVKMGGHIEGNADSYVSFYFNMQADYMPLVTRHSHAGTTSAIHIWVRDEIQPYMKIYSTGNTGKYWTVEGYKLPEDEV